MCVVSMIHEYHKPLPKDYWTDVNYEWFKELLKFAERYDEKTGQKDCLDPSKADFIKDVEKLLEEKYGITKKFDWEVGDTVVTSKEKPVTNQKSFMTDITLRSGLAGNIVEIEHKKNKVFVSVLFDVIPQWVPFIFDINSIKDSGLINTSSQDRREGVFRSSISGGAGGTGSPLNVGLQAS